MKSILTLEHRKVTSFRFKTASNVCFLFGVRMLTLNHKIEQLFVEQHSLNV